MYIGINTHDCGILAHGNCTMAWCFILTWLLTTWQHMSVCYTGTFLVIPCKCRCLQNERTTEGSRFHSWEKIQMAIVDVLKEVCWSVSSRATTASRSVWQKKKEAFVETQFSLFKARQLAFSGNLALSYTYIWLVSLSNWLILCRLSLKFMNCII